MCYPRVNYGRGITFTTTGDFGTYLQRVAMTLNIDPKNVAYHTPSRDGFVILFNAATGENISYPLDLSKFTGLPPTLSSLLHKH